MSLADKLKQHSSDEACSGCHSLMDPIVLGLENFDGIGRFRTLDNGFPIDPSGPLPNGTSFESPDGLIEILAEDEKLTKCMVEKTLTYALGRGLQPNDLPYQEQILAQFTESDFRFRSLIRAVMHSETFRMRRSATLTDEGGE